MILTVERGAPLRFEDGDDPCQGFDNCHFHRFSGHFPQLGLSAIHVGEWESETWIVVDHKRGRRSVLAARPHVSPAGTAIAGVSASETQWNGIEIWSVTPAGLARVLRFAPFQYSRYQFVGWDGENRVRLEATMASPDKFQAELVREEGGWRVRHLNQPRLECHVVGPKPRDDRRRDLSFEKDEIRFAGSTVARTGDTLRIRTKQGQRLTFQDGSCGDGCIYRFRQRLESNAVDLIERTTSDGAHTIILVDETSGGQAEVSAEPDFALDGRTFAVVSGGTVETWSIEPDGIKLQSRRTDDRSYCFAGWDGTDRLMLRTGTPGSQGAAGVDLVRTGETWTLKDAN